MIVEKRISFSRLLRLIWRELLCILVVSTLPVVFLIYFNLGDYAISGSIPMVVGTAIAIFLGFRTNSAYERWWEARKIWGEIINDSRNLVRLCNHFIGPIGTELEAADRESVRQIAYRQIAWAQILNRQLKDLPIAEGIDDLLDEQEYSAFTAAHDPILLLLAEQGKTVRGAHLRGRLDTRQLVLIEETISRLTVHYGGCQRIKMTVFPVHYSFFTRVFIWIFVFLLACSLPSHEHANHYTLIPAIFLIGWIFFMVEGIGSYMQRPFVNNRNVISMDAISRVIEMDLRDAIGETELPERIEPINGALY